MNTGKRAILVELDYKGNYRRYAVTPLEFAKAFPTVMLTDESCTEELRQSGVYGTGVWESRPMVHFWFAETTIGSEIWDTFFTDMAWGLPDSDIDSGNLAEVVLDESEPGYHLLLEDVRQTIA